MGKPLKPPSSNPFLIRVFRTTHNISFIDSRVYFSLVFKITHLNYEENIVCNLLECIYSKAGRTPGSKLYLPYLYQEAKMKTAYLILAILLVSLILFNNLALADNMSARDENKRGECLRKGNCKD